MVGSKGRRLSTDADVDGEEITGAQTTALLLWVLPLAFTLTSLDCFFLPIFPREGSLLSQLPIAQLVQVFHSSHNWPCAPVNPADRSRTTYTTTRSTRALYDFFDQYPISQYLIFYTL